MSRNGCRIKFNLFADYKNEKLVLTFQKASPVTLPLLSVSTYFNILTVSKCLSGEEEIKADCIASFSTVYPVCWLPLHLVR